MSEVKTIRHSWAHLLAMAVLDIFPEAKFWTWPDTKDGFYYDINLDKNLTSEDLKAIEKKMKNLSQQAFKFEQSFLPIDESIEFLEKNWQEFKVEIAKDLKEAWEKELSFFKSWNFTDLCSWPHVEHTWKIKHFKLTNISWAYFRWNSDNAMMQRINWICFETKEELQDYEKMLVEAKKRDHRVLWKKLDLFSFHEEWPWFPFWHPKWNIVFDELVNFMRKENKKRWYNEIKTPPILNEELWHKSWHWANFQENMYFTDIDEKKYAIKPMNCPWWCLVYKAVPKSYRDFPLKNAEFWLVHRHELSWVLHWLLRVRSFTQDDAHIFCTEVQLANEIKETIEFTLDIYKKFWFEKVNIFIATRPEKSMWSDEVWDLATDSLKDSLENLNLPYEIKEWEWAFYWPKIEFNIEDSLWRNWQLWTIQVDFSMPWRFDLEYTSEEWDKKVPVMIHRAIFWSLERFIWILIEHTSWALPLFIAPVQASIIPVASVHEDYANEVYEKLFEKWIRVEKTSSIDSLWKRVRTSETNKVPYSIIIWDEEVENNNITIRQYWTDWKQEKISLEEFVEKIRF